MPLEMYQESKPVILAVASGKGGVGKSTVSVNLALALKEMGKRVGLLDTDLYGPSVRRMLPEDRMPTQDGETIIPALCSGIRMISMAYFRKEHEAAIVRAPIANNIVSQFINNVQWGPLDVLIIDFPPGTGDIQLTLSQQARISGAILVTTPQEVAVMDVRKSAHMFHQVKIPVLGIVENMSGYGPDRIPLFGEGGGERLAGEIGAPLLAKLPIDPELSARADRGLSIFNPPETLLAPLFRTLGEKVLANLDETLQVRHVGLADAHTLLIQWSDGKESSYSLSELQRSCPCAGCNENPPAVDDGVGASEVTQIGRYALKITFTSGCSNGLFSFDELREKVRL